MSSVTNQTGRVAGKRQGRRVMPALRKKSVEAKSCEPLKLTLGELIAAAFDTMGDEVKDVVKLLSSPHMACAIQRRIVVL